MPLVLKRAIRYAVLIAVCITVSLLSFSCGSGDTPAKQRAAKAEKAKGDIIIGAAGPWSEKRNLLMQGISLSTDRINASGGLLNGRKIKVVWGDDKRTAEQGQLIAQEFSENTDMVAVIGHSNSFISIPASIMYQYNGLLMLSPLSTNPKLTSQGYGLVFRNIPNDAGFGRGIAEYCKKHGIDDILIYQIRDDFGQGQSNAFEIKAEELGLKILDRQSYDSTINTEQIRQDILYWKNNYRFRAIVLIGIMPKAAEIISEIRKLGIDVPILGGDALDHPMLTQIAGKYAEGVYAASVFHPDADYPAVKSFSAEFIKKYGKKPDIGAAQGFDAVNVLAEGIRQANTTVPSKVADALHNLKNYKGLTGQYSFDKKGDPTGRPIMVKVMHNGSFEIAK
ncbi:MAG: ABC transporter substrate-binding protein [Deferribacterales bacterium]